MIARVRKSLDENQKGFTLIELLVVVIIIGILAAIAIPMFLSQQKKAWEKQVVSDIKNASTAAMAYATDNNGAYTGVSTAVLISDYGFNETEDVKVVVTPKDQDGTTNGAYEVAGTHDKLSGTWTYDSVTGKIDDGAAVTPPVGG